MSNILSNPEEFEDDYQEANQCCNHCGRSYCEIDYEYQSCSKCGWDQVLNKFGPTRQPDEGDYMSGDADMLTGRWY